MSTLSLQETILWSEDHTYMCAGSPVVPAANFTELAIELAVYPEVTKTVSEIVHIFKEQSKRFSACGGNDADRFGVIRRNPKSGWQYIEDLITAK